MSDGIDGGAPAPAESNSAPAIADPGVQTPEPIRTEPSSEPAKPEPTHRAPSSDEAVRRATEKVEARERAEAKGGAKPDPAKVDVPVRDGTGKFAAKDTSSPEKSTTEPVRPLDTSVKAAAASASDAPERFSPEAKAAWATTPDTVRAETARAVREMTAGIEKYRPDAEAYNTVREFAEMAKAGGTDLPTALKNYVGIEQQLRADPIRGLEAVCGNIGVSLRQVAEHVLGRSPDQAGAASDALVREARGHAQHFQSLAQRQAEEIAQLRAEVEGFYQERIKTAASAEPRFDELKPLAGKLLMNGLAEDLPQAITMAKRLTDEPVATSIPSAASAATAPASAAQTRGGSRSIAGAPSPGSDPATRKPASTNRDAIDRAFARLG